MCAVYILVLIGSDTLLRSKSTIHLSLVLIGPLEFLGGDASHPLSQRERYTGFFFFSPPKRIPISTVPLSLSESGLEILSRLVAPQAHSVGGGVCKYL